MMGNKRTKTVDENAETQPLRAMVIDDGEVCAKCGSQNTSTISQHLLTGFDAELRALRNYRLYDCKCHACGRTFQVRYHA
jgi:transposase-like protein